MRDLTKIKGFPAVEQVTLEGGLVTLVPYQESLHLEKLWDALGRDGINDLLKYFPQDSFNGPSEFGAWLQSVQTTFKTLVFIENATGDVVGMASYMRPDPVHGVVEVGSVAHGHKMKRSAISTEVHYLMAKHVFETLGYRRYEWKCHHENLPSRATANRLGFVLEGIFRQHMISKGENRNTVWFSMIDSEWPLNKLAFEAWLAPSNFTADGQQIQKLEDLRAEVAN